ncbi:hypothetical protein WEN_01080 [Mycoplasma wenyonii str. Massachusetts]|mgnify:CR=1 FL=1|uniref:Uncharacterized protein n=1 Tax=Mycoplasma wenyonii (strain Massachusetts) TaxID=1197325 RepID=I6ZIK7_MYCWM|nr:hypothetical protein [Mycoplasma wenyonii]AFN65015.1 hypothetical protein WEN_01080 [Mycoplasma wenyonii str. Massachusetts]
MEKLSLAEKQEILAGFAKKGVSKTTSNKFKWNTSNLSLVALSSIPSIWMIIEGIISLSTKRPTNNFSFPYRGGYSSYGSNNYQSNKRDFFAYASEAYRPSLKLTPYPSRNSINFGLPWLV